MADNMDGGRDNGFDMDEMMGFGDPATEDGGNEPAGPPAANYDAPRRQSSASTGSSGSFVGGYAGPSNPNSPIKKQSSVEIAAENGNQRLNSSRSVADVYADQWLHPFPRKHAAVNLKELNDLFGISADIKATDTHIFFEKTDQTDYVCVRMVCMFSFYCTKLHPQADDGGKAGDETIPELDQQDVATFNKYHYPGVPVLAKVDGGFIDKDETRHSIIVKWQHEELTFNNKEAEREKVKEALKDLAVKEAQKKRGPNKLTPDEIAQIKSRYQPREGKVDEYLDNMADCNVKKGACPAPAWDLLQPKEKGSHGKAFPADKLDSVAPPGFTQYRIQSRYVLKKPLVVTPMSLPTDVYKFRYEIDLNPTYIYRLTPVFGKNVDKPKIVKGSWDEVNSLPLEKLNDTLIDAIKLAEDIFKFDPENKRPSNHTWAEPGGKERSVKEWMGVYMAYKMEKGKRVPSYRETARLFLMDAKEKEQKAWQTYLQKTGQEKGGDKKKEAAIAERSGSIAAYHICPSDTHFEDAPLKGKKGRVHGSAKKLLKNYIKNILPKDQRPIDEIFSHLQFGLRLKMLEILKGDSGNGNVDLVAQMPDGMTLKRTSFQPRIKYAMKKRWLKHSKDDSTHLPEDYDFGKALDAYRPDRIDNVMPGFNVLTKVWDEELWPKLSLRQESSEQFIPSNTTEDSQNSLCLELYVARNFWPVVLAVQLPMWTILLLVPFAWEFLRTKAEQGFFEAYGYLAALLLTAVAHRGVVDSFTEKIPGLTWFDVEFTGVLFWMMVTWIGVATAISWGHTDDGLGEEGGDNDDEMGNMFKENYDGYIRTAFFVQLTVYGFYVLYQIGRLLYVERAFQFAQPDGMATRGLQDMEISTRAYISPRKDGGQWWWPPNWCAKKRPQEYIHQRHELLRE